MLNATGDIALEHYPVIAIVVILVALGLLIRVEPTVEGPVIVELPGEMQVVGRNAVVNDFSGVLSITLESGKRVCYAQSTWISVKEASK